MGPLRRYIEPLEKAGDDQARSIVTKGSGTKSQGTVTSLRVPEMSEAYEACVIEERKRAIRMILWLARISGSDEALAWFGFASIASQVSARRDCTKPGASCECSTDFTNNAIQDGGIMIKP